MPFERTRLALVRSLPASPGSAGPPAGTNYDMRHLVIAAAGAATFAVSAAMGSAATTSLLLTLPYLLLLASTAGVSRRIWVGLLACLVVGTSIGLWSAGTDSTGGLIFIWLLPLQILLGTLPFPLKADASPVDASRAARGS